MKTLWDRKAHLFQCFCRDILCWSCSCSWHNVNITLLTLVDVVQLVLVVSAIQLTCSILRQGWWDRKIDTFSIFNFITISIDTGITLPYIQSILPNDCFANFNFLWFHYLMFMLWNNEELNQSNLLCTVYISRSVPTAILWCHLQWSTPPPHSFQSHWIESASWLKVKETSPAEKSRSNIHRQ